MCVRGWGGGGGGWGAGSVLMQVPRISAELYTQAISTTQDIRRRACMPDSRYTTTCVHLCC